MGVSPAVGAVSAGVDVDDDVAGVDVDAVDAVNVAAAAGETPAYHTVAFVAQKNRLIAVVRRACFYALQQKAKAADGATLLTCFLS